MLDIVDELTVATPGEVAASPRNPAWVNVNVYGCIPDGLRPGQFLRRGPHLFPVRADTQVSDIINDFKSRFPNEFGNKKDLRLKYNHRIYTNGLVSRLGLTNNAQVELISLGTEEMATQNQGFVFAFWSSVPLMFAISFLVAGLVGRFSAVVRGVYVLIGTILGIPGFVGLVIGLTELYSRQTHVAYSGDAWFGPCDQGCCCKRRR